MTRSGEIAKPGEKCFHCHGSGETNEPMTFNGRGTCYVCAGSGKPNPAHPYYRDRAAEARAERMYGPGETATPPTTLAGPA